MFTDFLDGRGASLVTAILIGAVALLALVAIFWLMRGRSNATFIRGGKNRRPRLAVLDATAVDTRRRLVLVRRDDVEHLILIGGPTDLVVESRIVAGLGTGEFGIGKDAISLAQPAAPAMAPPVLQRAQSPVQPAATPALPQGPQSDVADDQAAPAGRRQQSTSALPARAPHPRGPAARPAMAPTVGEPHVRSLADPSLAASAGAGAASTAAGPGAGTSSRGTAGATAADASPRSPVPVATPAALASLPYTANATAGPAPEIAREPALDTPSINLARNGPAADRATAWNTPETGGTDAEALLDSLDRARNRVLGPSAPSPAEQAPSPPGPGGPLPSSAAIHDKEDAGAGATEAPQTATLPVGEPFDLDAGADFEAVLQAEMEVARTIPVPVVRNPAEDVAIPSARLGVETVGEPGAPAIPPVEIGSGAPDRAPARDARRDPEARIEPAADREPEPVVERRPTLDEEMEKLLGELTPRR